MLRLFHFFQRVVVFLSGSHDFVLCIGCFLFQLAYLLQLGNDKTKCRFPLAFLRGDLSVNFVDLGSKNLGVFCRDVLCRQHALQLLFSFCRYSNDTLSRSLKTPSQSILAFSSEVDKSDKDLSKAACSDIFSPCVCALAIFSAYSC